MSANLTERPVSERRLRNLAVDSQIFAVKCHYFEFPERHVAVSRGCASSLGEIVKSIEIGKSLIGRSCSPLSVGFVEVCFGLHFCLQCDGWTDGHMIAGRFGFCKCLKERGEVLFGV